MTKMSGLAKLMVTAVLLSATSAGIVHATTSTSVLSAERQDYLKAYRLAGRDRRVALEGVVKGLAGYPLLPYLEYRWIKRRLSTTDSDTINRFLEANQGQPVAKLMRRVWLHYLAKRRRWHQFLEVYRDTQESDLRCTYLSARVRLKQDDGLLAEIVKTWLKDSSLPKACDLAFSRLYKSGVLTEELVWERVGNAMRAGNPKLANYLERHLPRALRPAVRRWVAMRADPERQLGRSMKWTDTPQHRQIVSYGARRLAAPHPEKARSHWLALQTKFSFTATQAADVERRIALMAATDYLPSADDWLAALPESVRDEQILQWRVRLALFAQAWERVLPRLDELTERDQRKPEWRYWRARALEKSGESEAARSLYQALAAEANFFGFLAADHLNLYYSICPKLRNIDRQQLGEVLDNDAFVRAMELYRVDQLSFARLEWAHAMQAMDREQRRHAAILAAQEDWHEMAISTFADTGSWRHYAMRFPLAYQQEIMASANKPLLDQALVYAVLRAESAFAEDARSSAGALGLMQLMPHIGRQLARREGRRSISTLELFEATRNIRFGSAHLHDYLNQHAMSPVLATAAYNAGPGPVGRWLDRTPPSMPADIWIATVPYRETRDYIERVLAFTVIYDWRLDSKVTPLSLRMPGMGDPPKAAPSGQDPVVCRL